MDGNMSQGGSLSGVVAPSYGGFDFLDKMEIHHYGKQPNTMYHHLSQNLQGSSLHSSVPGSFVLNMGTGPHCDRRISLAEFGACETKKNSASEDDEPSITEEVDLSKSKKGLPWQRIKWTDNMVKLLITAVSYLTEDSLSGYGYGGRRRFSILQKNGKWKLMSKVMAERGYHVSPQQCEDKFNDLNKRYNKLNEILGRGTSCQVVEKPALLDMMNHISARDKDKVRKILSSKQLFYEEMCSCHNGNRLHLPHDPALQHSLQAALRSRDDPDNEDDREMETDDQDEFEENLSPHGSVNKLRRCQGQTDTNQVLESLSAEIEERKLQIQVEMLEMEKQKLKWRKFCKLQDNELEKMRMENEKMKLQNERMALELKRKEVEAGLK